MINMPQHAIDFLMEEKSNFWHFEQGLCPLTVRVQCGLYTTLATRERGDDGGAAGCPFAIPDT